MAQVFGVPGAMFDRRKLREYERMNINRGIQWMMLMLVLFSASSLSGCVKGRSAVIVEEMELCGPDKLSITNPLGNVKVSGTVFNEPGSVISIKTEKYVDTYSLFGLASPDDYVGQVLVTPVVLNNAVEMNVKVGARQLLDRLFVRVVPHVNRTVEAPTTISVSAETNIGDIELNNLAGDVSTSVSAGKVIVDAASGIWGEQHYKVQVGELLLSCHENSGFHYDLAVDIGHADVSGLDISPERRFMGVRAVGLAGRQQRPGLVTAAVNIGNISIAAK